MKTSEQFRLREGFTLRPAARWLIALFAVGALNSSLYACNIPVFRYALERWEPDRYELTIYHRGPLTGQKQTELAALAKYLDDEKCPVNVTLDRVDASRLMTAFSAAHDDAWMVLRYPSQAQITTPVYQGPLDGAAIKRMLDSPARRAIVQRILQGESAVWVFLDSGNKAKDDAAHERLQKSLTDLEKTLKLPMLSDSPKDKLQAEHISLKIAFSIVRIAANDPQEDMLRRMLVNMDDDIAGRNEPMAFPVFGRGIALYAMVGKGINADTIHSAARFLTEQCSCEAKRQNPGVDLLMTATWQESLGGKLIPPPEPPPLTGLLNARVANDEPDVTTNSTTYQRVQDTDSGIAGLWTNLAIGMGGGVVILILMTCLLLRRGQ